jgi:hypothetical protein
MSSQRLVRLSNIIFVGGAIAFSMTLGSRAFATYRSTQQSRVASVEYFVQSDCPFCGAIRDSMDLGLAWLKIATRVSVSSIGSASDSSLSGYWRFAAPPKQLPDSAFVRLATPGVPLMLLGNVDGSSRRLVGDSVWPALRRLILVEAERVETGRRAAEWLVQANERRFAETGSYAPSLNDVPLHSAMKVGTPVQNYAVAPNGRSYWFARIVSQGFECTMSVGAVPTSIGGKNAQGVSCK